MENLQEIQEVKVHTKDWSNPTPAGLVGFAVACFCFFALLNGFVEGSAIVLLACWLFGGFAIQIVVAIVDLKNGNTTGGNTFLFFSGFFMLAGSLGNFVKYNASLSDTFIDARLDGYAWLVLTLVVLLWTPAFTRVFSLLSVIWLILDVALPFITLIDLKVLPGSFAPIPGYLLLLAGIVAIYLSAAIIVNTAYGRNVYPIIQPKSK